MHSQDIEDFEAASRRNKLDPIWGRTIGTTRCHACGKLFGGTAGFDDHRIGKFVDEHPSYGRRCSEGSELKELGYRLVDGIWKKPLAPDVIEKLRKLGASR